MSIALIDNSTLSSIQRVLGKIEIKNKDTIDGDLAAFDSFISSILFYNEQIVIDDYKPEYSDERKKQFSYLKFIDPKTFDLSKIEKKSKEEADKLSPKIQNGKFVDEGFKEFFDLLNINIKCTWDISSSIYYLTLKMLGTSDTYQYQKYSKVCNSIYSELLDSDNAGEKRNYSNQLYDGNGYKIDSEYKIPGAKWGNGETGGLTAGLATFIASLNWISYRSIYYTYLSEYLKAETFLHPIRQSFQVFYMEKASRFDLNFTSGLLDKFETLALNEIENIISSNKSYAVALRIPFLLGHIISKTENPQDIINYAFELRDKKEFVQARSDFGILREMISTDGFTPKLFRETKKINKNIIEGFNSIRRNYGITTIQGDLTSTSINTFNSITSNTNIPQIPDILKDSRLANLVSNYKSRKSFGFIYRDFSKDLLNISRLGKYHDLITKDVKFSERSFDNNLKYEDPKYMKFHSEWKSPMV